MQNFDSKEYRDSLVKHREGDSGPKKFFSFIIVFILIMAGSLIFAGQVFAATITFGTVAGNWSDASKWVGGVLPSATDDVVFDANSANCAVDTTGAVAKTLDMTNSAGTLTITNGMKLSVSGNVTLKNGKFTAGGDTANITMLASGTLITAGNTIGALTINGAGITVTLGDSFTQRAGSVLSLLSGNISATNGTHTFGYFISNSSTGISNLDITNSTVNIIGSSFQMQSGTATLTATGSTVNVNTSSSLNFFAPNNTVFNNLIYSGNGGITFLNNITFHNLTIDQSANANKNSSLSDYYGNITIDGGTLTLKGGADNRYRFLLTSHTLGTQQTISLINGATFVGQRVDFRDIRFAAPIDLSSYTTIPGGAGDSGGNSNITFPAPRNLYWYSPNALNNQTFYYSNYGGGTNPWWTTPDHSSGELLATDSPLPQDNVFFNASSIRGTGTTVSMDQPRAGSNLDFTGAASSLSFSAANAWTAYGSFTLSSLMNYTGGNYLTLEGRGTLNLTSAGKTFPGGIYFQPVGSYNLQDNLTVTNGIYFNNGAFNANTYNVAASLFSVGAGTTISMGSGNWKTTNTGSNTVWTGSGTVNSQTSTLELSGDSTTVTRTFSPAAGTVFNNLTISGKATSSALWNITNSFNFKGTLTIASTNRIKATSGTIYTVSSDLVTQLPTFDLISPNNTTSATNPATFTFSYQAYTPGSSDPLVALSKYQLYVDGVLNTDNINSTSSSINLGLMSYGVHTWQIKAINALGNFVWSTSIFKIAALNNWVKNNTGPIHP